MGQVRGEVTYRGENLLVPDDQMGVFSSPDMLVRKKGLRVHSQRTTSNQKQLPTKNNNLDKSAVKNKVQFHKSVHYTILQSKICYQAWPQKSRKQLSKYVCLACSRDKWHPKRFSKENMIPSSVPKELQEVTQIKEMLIARTLPLMTVYVKPGGQRGYSGHIINLPQGISELAESLPRYPKNVPYLVVSMKGKESTCKEVIVRREKVEKALMRLRKIILYLKMAFHVIFQGRTQTQKLIKT